MIIKCGECDSAYEFDPNRIGKKGSKVRCSVCGHVFKIFPPSSLESPSSPAEPDASSATREPAGPAAGKNETLAVGEKADDEHMETGALEEPESGGQPDLPGTSDIGTEAGAGEHSGPEATAVFADDEPTETMPFEETESPWQPGLPETSGPGTSGLGAEDAVAETGHFGPEETVATADGEPGGMPLEETESVGQQDLPDISDPVTEDEVDESGGDFGPEETIAMDDDPEAGQPETSESPVPPGFPADGASVPEETLSIEDEDDEFGPEETIAIGSAFPEEAAEAAPEDELDRMASRVFRDSHADIPPEEAWTAGESAEIAHAGKKRIGKQYKPFRAKLINFAAIIIGLIAVIVIPIETYRPIERLFQLIENGKVLMGGLESAFEASDLEKINQFALKVLYIDLKKDEQLASNEVSNEKLRKLRYDSHQLERVLREKEIYPETKKMLGRLGDFPGREETDELYYRPLSFNMLLLEGKILPEKEIMENIDPEYIELFTEGFKYERLLRTEAYWREMFKSAPGIHEILGNHKRAVMSAKANSESAGFTISEIYVMLDTGKEDGYFKDNIVYLLDSISWHYDSTTLAGPYEITENRFWRRLALEGKNGYGHNPFINPQKDFPENLWPFDTDEYGTWFGVWYTKQTNGLFNTFSIDFDATGVIKLILMIGVSVLSLGVVLIILVILITKWLSSLVTRPITALTKGADAVSQGNYDYVVPIFKEDEFGDLTKQFNKMTKGQRERLNLMETLEKLLSKDLAEKAAQSGLVIGGQRADCTVMFTDFAGFSTITQHMGAAEAVNILNFYFSGLIPIIKKYGGFPDKYIGDAIVGLFGAPVRLEDHAERAVACAIEMQWKMREMNEQRRKQGRTIFEMRIGLNSGEVLVGAIGCDLKLEFTSIGETTNLANRMEAICEIGHVMVADGTYRKIQNTFFERVDIERTPRKVQVKGYPEPVSCYCIHVDNLKVEKDMLSDVPAKSFYIYSDGGHDIKTNPQDIQGVNFTSVAKYRFFTEE